MMFFLYNPIKRPIAKQPIILAKKVPMLNWDLNDFEIKKGAILPIPPPKKIDK